MDGKPLGLYDWDQLNGQLFWVYDAPVPAVGSNRNRVASRYSAWLIREGEVETGPTGGEKIKAGKGEWVFPPPTGRRDQVFAPGTRALSLNFLAEWPDGRLLVPFTRTIRLRAAEHPGLERIARRLLAIAGRQLGGPVAAPGGGGMDFETYAAVKEAFWRWLREWLRAMEAAGAEYAIPAAVDGRVQAIMKILDGMSFTGEIPYDYFEKAAGLGRVQIDRLFVRAVGLTPRKYLERRLVASAKAQLQGTSLSVKEIAARLNFSSDAHFCAWFRRKIGEYPQRFRTDIHG